MNFNCYAVGLVVLVVFTSCTLIKSQDNPATRCELIVNGPICLDCTHTAQCVNGELATSNTSCSVGEVCESGVIDGFCTLLTSSSSSICMCKNIGCFPDPNNPAAYVSCDTTDVVGERAPPLTDGCNYSQEQFNIETCSCVSAVCPVCGLLAGDTSTCSITYYNCQDFATEPDPIQCADGMCFDQVLCKCSESAIVSTPSTTMNTGSTTVDTTNTGTTISDTTNTGPTISDTTNTGPIIIDTTNTGTTISDTTNTGTTISDTTNTGTTISDTTNTGTTIIVTTNTGPTVIGPTTIPSFVCPECGYAPDSADCNNYIICGEGQSTLSTCPPGMCFFSETCACLPYSGCPACGYIADPTNCNAFYICDVSNPTSELVASYCPPDFCFSVEFCACLPS